ncbi:MAG: GNAT family N-acetyltransferase [Chlamydiales bacterium]|nr:GNAT family N-acetyltransferase [Chlamydiales bacterium]
MIVQASSDISFHQVGGQYHDKMHILTEIFTRILEPLYGSQSKALSQIRESKDRKCFLMYEQENPVGVLVFKTEVSDEFADCGAPKSIEIKSLFVDQSMQNSGRGLGSRLVDKLKEEVNKLGIDYLGLHVTVSETKPESLAFFKRKGFVITHEWQGRYQKDVTEYLLSCPIHTGSMEPSVEDLSTRFSGLSTTDTVPELMHIIHNAHSDDIHSLKKLSDGTFVSGSKDNGICKWDFSGHLVRVVDEVEPTLRSEANWITAMEVVNDYYWVSGARNGDVVLWKTNGDYVKELKPKLPRTDDHHSKQQNLRRVTCLAPGSNPLNPSFFIGFPTLFQSFNLIEGKTTSITKVHKNDWVYVIKPVDAVTVLTVVGPVIKVWKESNKGWTEGATVMGEQPRYRDAGKSQRSFISDMICLGSQTVASAHFDSTVRLVDVLQNKVVETRKEHTGKVWKLEKFTEQLFASSGDDETVKLWDVRQSKSVHTIAVNHGPITSMLALNDNVLVTGSNKDSAELRFYNIRK